MRGEAVYGHSGDVEGNRCLIFGGSGFIGTHLARHFLCTNRFAHIHIADINKSPLQGAPKISTSLVDVRKPIPLDLLSETPEWIFNLAAIHREPGHVVDEYFETNLCGAHNVCAYAEAVQCSNIFFTSSISVYGPTTGPTDEQAQICPTTPYGASKYPAELIHRCWEAHAADRRLLICRPAVVYGAGDPGNMMRMIRAVRRGYFAFPGSPGIHKSYAYVFGLLESVAFVMERPEKVIVYNYAEYPTEPLGVLVSRTKEFLHSSAPVFSIPTKLLLPAAHAAQMVFGKNNPIHPTRVRKAGMPTHIIPGWLRDHGFQFRFSFQDSLAHWRQIAPEDFA
jgi:nucleoside-diphosphate-sugar epimerase